MKQWLQQLQTVRKSREGHQQLSDAARQIRVEQAMQTISESQQAPFNAQQSKMTVADYWQQMMEAKQLADEEQQDLPLDRKGQIAAALEAQRLKFDPFAPAPDPVSPEACTRYAAAAALPGDLPRGDPANFSTGEAAGSATGVEAASSGAAAAVAVPAGAAGGE